MKWKNFNEEEMPFPRFVVVRSFDLQSKMQPFTASIRRPYDDSPEKYNPNYYEIKTPYSLNWFELDDSFKEKFEWLDPFEDKKDNVKP